METFHSRLRKKRRQSSKPDSVLLAESTIYLMRSYPGLKRSGPFLVPYLILLRTGFTLPPLSPAERWALTPPFHPYPAVEMALPSHCRAVCFLRHFPSPAVLHRRSRVNHGTSCPAESGLSSLSPKQKSGRYTLPARRKCSALTAKKNTKSTKLFLPPGRQEDF